MSNQVYLEERFYKFLVSLEELRVKKEKLIFLSSIGISEDEYLEYISFLQQINIQVKFDENYVYPLEFKNSVKVEFSLSEWLSMQFIANSFGKEKGFPYRLVKNKIEKVSTAHAQFNLIRSSYIKENHQVDHLPNLIKKLDHSLVASETVAVHFKENKQCKLIPLRLVYIDGVLCLIGEELDEKNLSYFAIEDIIRVDTISTESSCTHSQIEVNDFIMHVRLINNSEERLILKIYSPTESDLLPKFHHLENPFVTSNPEGDMIWAATIEMCDDVYKWLYDMKDHIEILDPGHIRKEFAHYCELKKQAVNTKKAS